MDSPSDKRIRLDGVLSVKKEFRAPPKEFHGDLVEKLPPQKRRGQNKAKDRQFSFVGDAIKLCFRTAMGEECTNENCKSSHDAAAYLDSKGPDIGENCILYELYGSCKFGLKCRYLKGHKEIVDRGIAPQTINALKPNDIKEIRSKKLPCPKSDSFQKIWEKIETGDNILDVNDSEIKVIDFKGKTYLAPLTTVGNLPFRRICKNFGVDITCAEMVLAQNLLSGSQNEWSLMKRHASEDIFGIQITGNHPVSFARACDAINQKFTFDFIDINLGCPVEAITCSGNGSALMEKKHKLEWMIKGARFVTDKPITVKMRTGIRDKKLTAHNLIPLVKSWGAAAVTLHGRTKEQRYTKLADWDYINECGKEISDRENFNYFGNGDIFSPVDYAERLRTNQNIDGVMIGRGALIKPWIFKEIKEGKVWDISASERFDILRQFSNYGLEHWGSDTIGVNQTRKFLCEWQSFLHRYVPVGILEYLPQQMNQRPEAFVGRNDLETLLASDNASDWIKISEMILGPAPESFNFIPKYKMLI